MANKKIIWAMDPFSKSTKRTQVAAETAKKMATSLGAEIEPVFILSPDGFNFTGDFSPGWIKDFKPKAERKMRMVLNKLGMSDLQPKIIVNRSFSQSGDAKKLINYARRQKALAILLATHARSGIARLVMGSFSETTLLQTKVPLVLVNPDSPAMTKMKTILFATDCSNESKKAFMMLVKLAQAAKAKIILYHKLPDPIEPVVQTGVHLAGGGWVSVQQYLSKDQQEKKKKLESWAAAAKKSKVSTKVIIDETPGFVTEAIIEQVKATKADMISLLSKSNAISSVLIGSVGRQIARHSPVPVHLMHKDS